MVVYSELIQAMVDLKILTEPKHILIQWSCLLNVFVILLKLTFLLLLIILMIKDHLIDIAEDLV